MDWQERTDFDEVQHGNKPFAMRIPSLLVTRDTDGSLNFLTAMWFTPVGAEPSRLVVGVSRTTFTYDRLLRTGEFVLSAPTRKMMDAVVFAGRISGRDVDKWQAAGFTAVKPAKISVPLIGEAIGNVEYKVVNRMALDDEIDLFVGEVLAAHVRKGAMEGELFGETSDPLLYLGTKYDQEGNSLGKHLARFSGIEVADYDSPLLKRYVKRR